MSAITRILRGHPLPTEVTSSRQVRGHLQHARHARCCLGPRAVGNAGVRHLREVMWWKYDAFSFRGQRGGVVGAYQGASPPRTSSVLSGRGSGPFAPHGLGQEVLVGQQRVKNPKRRHYGAHRRWQDDTHRADSVLR